MEPGKKRIPPRVKSQNKGSTSTSNIQPSRSNKQTIQQLFDEYVLNINSYTID